MSRPIAEHDIVVLLQDLPDEGLQAGDVGVVLLSHPGREGVRPGYTIEVTTLLGETIAVVSIPADIVRPVSEYDVRHTRPSPIRA